MRYIDFPGYEFDARKLKHTATKSEYVFSKLITPILKDLPNNVKIREFANTSSISLNGKKINVSAIEFDLAGEYQKCLQPLIRAREDRAIVFYVQFIDETGFRSDISEWSNKKYAVGFKFAEEEKATLSVGDKAEIFGKNFKEDAVGFFNGISVDQAIAASLPKNTTFATRMASLVVARSVYKGADFAFKSRHGDLLAIVLHDADDSDRAYGSEYHSNSKRIKFNSVKEVEEYNWDALFEYLYEHRHGTLIRKGSLGT